MTIPLFKPEDDPGPDFAKTPAQTVEKLVPYAMKKWGKKVYVVAADYNYGQITSQWVKKYVLENGGEVPSIDFFPLDALPELSSGRVLAPQILRLYQHHLDRSLPTDFD